MKVRLDLYNNSWFKPGRNVVVRTLWFFINALVLNSNLIPISSIKIILLRIFGSKIGKGVVIKPNVNIKYPWKLTIGDYSWIGEGVWIDNLDEIVIGAHCCLSQGCMLLCGNHNYKKETFDLITKPISIMEGAWVGAKAVVCPGVNLNPHSILSVGSIATTDLSENCIYSGNPAVFKKERNIK